MINKFQAYRFEPNFYYQGPCSYSTWEKSIQNSKRTLQILEILTAIKSQPLSLLKSYLSKIDRVNDPVHCLSKYENSIITIIQLYVFHSATISTSELNNYELCMSISVEVICLEE